MFQYHCPDCHTAHDLHEPRCSFSQLDRHEYEKAYIDIISTLSAVICSRDSLKQHIGDWEDIHESVLTRLKELNRVVETDEGHLRLLRPEERRYSRRPSVEPLATIYRYGTYSGCHDNGLFALLAYYAQIDLSWDETKEQLLEWFERTGTWERGGFEEPSPEALIEKKRHVWEEGYGWKRIGEAAKEVIDRNRRGPTTDSHSNTESASG